MGRYPDVEPYAGGYLPAADGHELHWEACGNPRGRPAVVLHGGPGSGCTPAWRKLFDPAAFRVVLFDQRGCGRSRPHAGGPRADLSANSTSHLIADIEALREHLGIERWLVLGGSWGSTLGLAYAQRHPHRVDAMVLFSVVTTSRREVQWITRDVGRLCPPEWRRFAAGAGARAGESLVEAYSRLLDDPDPFVHERAARDWCDWEQAHVRLGGDLARDPRYDDASFRLGFARLVTHYWRHAAWLEDGELLRGLAQIAAIPAVLIHGRRDVSSPLDVPWEIAERWPAAELVVVEGVGHGAGEAMASGILAATDRFAREGRPVPSAGFEPG